MTAPLPAPPPAAPPVRAPFIRPLFKKEVAPAAPRQPLGALLRSVWTDLSSLARRAAHSRAVRYAPMLLMFILLSLPVVLRDAAMERWPATRSVYAFLHLALPPPEPERLVLQDVRSERRYQDGAMHLVIEGRIVSKAEKNQGVPALLAEALGPDGRQIQSWQIAPSKVKLTPGESATFALAVLSPEKNVTEVNLSFVEPPHDED